MKSIKDIATDLGLSKTSVRKIINRLDLWSSLQKEGNQFLISEEQEELIKNEYRRTKTETETNSETKTKTNSETNSELVSNMISVLTRELEQKNAQIFELQKLLEQEQQLRMVNEQKLIMIEQKQQEAIKPWQFWKKRRPIEDVEKS